MTIYTAQYPSPLGVISASAEDDAITGLWFVDQKYYPVGFKDWQRDSSNATLRQLGEWLEAYFSGQDRPFAGKLAAKGTAFRQQVWQILLQIPYGQTTTYGAIAKTLAKRNGQVKLAAQAVGGAVGHNPISLLIPCHRVVGSGGSLIGYGGGLDKKRALLKLEGWLP